MTGQTVVRRPTFEKSNTELTSSLRSNFAAHQPSPSPSSATSPTPKPSYRTWTTQEESTLYIPAHTPSPLSEPRESYDITVKLFYLPNIPSSRRCAHTRQAIDLVLRELGTTSIDLLIVSFPGISFDADDSDISDSDDENDPSTPPSVPTSASDADTDANANADGCCDQDTSSPEPIPTMLETWRTLESLHASGIVKKLGIAEFGETRLSRFLPHTKVRPSVDQINVRDCCVVPKPLILFAKREGIELLTHNDCTNVLPRGTVRELLGSGERGSGVLAGAGEEGGGRLKGDVEPQFVVKYTAVVKDRGVVENKGYFAVAELREEA